MRTKEMVDYIPTYEMGDPYKPRSEIKLVWNKEHSIFKKEHRKKDDPKAKVRQTISHLVKDVHYLLEFRDMASSQGWQPIDFDDGYDKIPWLTDLAEAKSIVKSMRKRFANMQLKWIFRLKEVLFERFVEV